MEQQRTVLFVKGAVYPVVAGTEKDGLPPLEQGILPEAAVVKIKPEGRQEVFAPVRPCELLPVRPAEDTGNSQSVPLPLIQAARRLSGEDHVKAEIGVGQGVVRLVKLTDYARQDDRVRAREAVGTPAVAFRFPAVEHVLPIAAVLIEKQKRIGKGFAPVRLGDDLRLGRGIDRGDRRLLRSGSERRQQGQHKKRDQTEQFFHRLLLPVPGAYASPAGVPPGAAFFGSGAVGTAVKSAVSLTKQYMGMP